MREEVPRYYSDDLPTDLPARTKTRVKGMERLDQHTETLPALQVGGTAQTSTNNDETTTWPWTPTRVMVDRGAKETANPAPRGTPTTLGLATSPRRVGTLTPR